MLKRPTRMPGPEGPRAGRARRHPYLVLLRVGFAEPACCHTAGELLPHRFTLTRLRRAVCFLLHFPSPCGALPLGGTLPCGVRTFLPADTRHGRSAKRLPGAPQNHSTGESSSAISSDTRIRPQCSQKNNRSSRLISRILWGGTTL